MQRSVGFLALPVVSPLLTSFSAPMQHRLPLGTGQRLRQTHSRPTEVSAQRAVVSRTHSTSRTSASRLVAQCTLLKRQSNTSRLALPPTHPTRTRTGAASLLASASRAAWSRLAIERGEAESNGEEENGTHCPGILPHFCPLTAPSREGLPGP